MSFASSTSSIPPTLPLCEEEILDDAAETINQFTLLAFDDGSFVTLLGLILFGYLNSIF